MSSTVSRSRRGLRVVAHTGLGVMLAATLSLAGPGGGTASASTAEDCASHGHSSARVGWGAAQGQDPNSVTAAAAQRMDEQLQ